MCSILNRQGYGYELSPMYEELIKKRIMEDWQPPRIEKEYVNLGTETIKSILNKIISLTWKYKPNISESDFNSKEKKEYIFSEGLKFLAKNKIFTKSFLKKIGLKEKEIRFKSFNEFLDN